MKVKMLEVFQGTGVTALNTFENITVSILEKGEIYEIGATLGAWLIENGKAEPVVSVIEPVKEEPPAPEATTIEIDHDESLPKRRRK